MQDVKNSEEYKRLLEKANYDDLTRVLNRRAGRECLEDLLGKARAEKKRLVIVLCDVNELKQINDRFGHKEGDIMLCHVANAMAQKLEMDDIIFRLSGDEFVTALYDIDKCNAEERVQSVLAHLREERMLMGMAYDISFSYGMVEVYPKECCTISDLIEKADKRMYIQKRNYHIRSAARKKEQQNSLDIQQFKFDKEHLFDALMNCTDDYVFAGNMKTGAFRYPPAMVAEFGLPGEVVENAAAFWGDKIHPLDKNSFLENNQEIVDGRAEQHDIEYRAQNAAGQWVWLRCRGQMVRDKSGAPELFAGLIINLDQNNQIDHLTGLHNRFEFEGDVKRYMVEHKDLLPLGIMILDMDSFHTINDLYNRSFGDTILKITAQKILEALPESAKAYRMDGDEFAVLIQDGSGADALEIFEKNPADISKIERI